MKKPFYFTSLFNKEGGAATLLLPLGPHTASVHALQTLNPKP